MPTLMGSINIIARCSRLYRNDRLKEYGIHGTMDSIILQVSKKPGMSQDEIAKRVCIDKSNASRKVAKLEEKGYVKRVPSEKDRRVQLVYPTEEGIKLCEEIKLILREWNSTVTDGLSEESSGLVLEALGTILEKARDYVAGREDDEK